MTSTPVAPSLVMSVRDVTKTFGSTRALDDVSLSIHAGRVTALLGRNGAGKSTLVAILSGLSTPDSGGIEAAADGGRPPRVGCVYQKSMLVPAATVAENIALGHYPLRFGMVDWREIRARAETLLAEWGYADIVDRPVDQLEPVERKIVEICRVLALEPDVLLLDEPTAGLDLEGSRVLFGKIREAAAAGVGIIYVSHHLDEVFEVCDDATVLRDGRVVAEFELGDTTLTEIVDAMVGPDARREAGARTSHATDDVVLDLQGLSVAGRFDDVSLQVRAGEVVALAGLDGAGHIQVAEAICGLLRPTAGTATLDGTALPRGDVRRAISAGVGFTPEDRHHGGYVPGMSVAENSTLSIMGRLRNRAGLLAAAARDRVYDRLAADWDIKAWGGHQLAEELSGGNQQKVVLARSVAADPDLLVLLNPTAGVDIAAKASIYRSIEQMAERGKAILIASADDSDFAICDRVIVMFRGTTLTEFRAPFTETDLTRAIQGELS